MNVMLVLDGKLITPALSDTILDGVTRDSVLTLASDEGMSVEERRIGYKELESAFRENRQIEMFGVGTAAVIAPIEMLSINGHAYYPNVADSANCFRFGEKLQRIQTGVNRDIHHWNHIIKIPPVTKIQTTVWQVNTDLR